MKRVTIEYTLPDNTEVTVVGTVTGGSSGNYTGHPDDRSEAEPPEAEIEHAYTTDENGQNHDINLWREEEEKIEAALIEKAEQERE